MSLKATLNELLEKYRMDHTHPMNKATHMIGIPMIVISLPMLFIAPWWGLALFVVGWIFQFIGHAFEGNMPSFFREPRFLLVGPMFFWSKLKGLFGRSKEQRQAS